MIYEEPYYYNLLKESIFTSNLSTKPNEPSTAASPSSSQTLRRLQRLIPPSSNASIAVGDFHIQSVGILEDIHTGEVDAASLLGSA